jgi:hypothetical protein
MINRAMRRPADFVIGGHDDPYLLRWYLVPWRKWSREARENPTCWRRLKGFVSSMLPSVYLHQFLRDDDDRALHDHPWFWCSIMLRGGYLEHTRRAHVAHWAPAIRFGTPWRAHRIQLFGYPTHKRVPAWTIFITGPRLRNWGFHCPNGWIPWQRFTAADDPGAIGPGCDA